MEIVKEWAMRTVASLNQVVMVTVAAAFMGVQLALIILVQIVMQT